MPSQFTSKEILNSLPIGTPICFHKRLHLYGADEGKWESTGEENLIVEKGKLRTPFHDKEFPFDRIPSGQEFLVWRDMSSGAWL